MAKYDLFSQAFFANPDPTFGAMRVHDPVYWEPTLEAWVVTRYQDVRAALRDSRFSAERSARIREASSPRVKEKLADCYQFLSKWMIFSDPPMHTRLRSVIGKVFTRGFIAGLEPVVIGLAHELIDGVRERGHMDVLRDFASPLTSTTSAKLIGIPHTLVPDMMRWSANVFRLFGAGIVSEEVVETAHRSLIECRECMRHIMRWRGTEPANDLLGQLMEGVTRGVIRDEDEIISSCVMLMIGGHESTAHMIGNGLLALLRNRSELEKLKARPELLVSAMEELLRYDGPSVSVLRRALQDIKVGGTLVRQGQFVFNVIRAANHDPEVFVEPDRLDIERGDNPHLGLGHGVHFCVGASLARLQMQAAIGLIIARLPELDLADTTLRWIPSLATRGLEALPVTFGEP
jgi:pimeloyl-[acyl-carrier protein] synthase